jgi:hypothetical protein
VSPPSVGWKPFTTRSDVASVRIRCLVPQRLLAANGWRSELFDAADPRRHDVVVFQKAYGADDLDLARRLSASGVRIVFDLCDNHFHNPGQGPEGEDRSSRLRRMIDLADAVTVSSPILAELVGKESSFVVDDALDPVITAPSARRRWRPRFPAKGLRLVWFGNAGSEDFGLVDLGRIVPELNRLHRGLPIALDVATNSKQAYRRHLSGVDFPTRYLSWSMQSFPAAHSRSDVCLLPITANPFTVCKTSNRLVTSVMLGVPVVADLIPSYEELAPYILVGHWEANVARYGLDPELRRAHVEQGQAFIRRRFAPEVVVGQWDRALSSVLG